MGINTNKKKVRCHKSGKKRTVLVHVGSFAVKSGFKFVTCWHSLPKDGLSVLSEHCHWFNEGLNSRKGVLFVFFCFIFRFSALSSITCGI